MAHDRSPRSRHVSMSGPRFFRDSSADRPRTLELLFDLLFVFCVAQLARLVDGDPTWGTAGVMVLLFVPIWWTWVNITFCTDRFPADDIVHRSLVLAAAAAAGVMGLALTDLGGWGSVGFAVGYGTARVVVVALYLRAGRAVPDARRQCDRYAASSAISAVLWFGSVLLPMPLRIVPWIVGTLVDVGVPGFIDRRVGLLPVDTDHLPDRCGAFVVIVLGESLVSTLADAAAAGPLTADRAVLLGLAFVITTALWWGFFDRTAMRLRYRALAGDRSGRMANIICGQLHFPLIVGVVFVAIGLQLAVEHPGGSIPAPAAIAAAGGGIAYLLALNVMTWVLGIRGGDSLILTRSALIVGFVLLVLFCRSWSSPAYLGACAVLLIVHVGANLRRDRQSASQASDTPSNPPGGGR